MSSEPKRKGLGKRVRAFLVMLLGAFVGGMGVAVFFVPTRLTMGGFSGLATILYHITGIPLSVGTLTVLLNLPILALGYFRISRHFVVSSVVGTFVYSVMVDLCTWIVSKCDLRALVFLNGGKEVDLFICSVVGGVVFGLGLGLMLIGGYTTGGTDIVAVLIRRRWKGISIGMGIWLVDAAVILTALIVYQHQSADSVRLALYSAIALFLTTKAIDFVMEGFNFKRTAIIISPASEAIAGRIMRELDRGVTGLHGRGMYTQKEGTVLICVLASHEIRALKRIAVEEDPAAFVFLMDTREVLGEGFEGDLFFS